MNEFSNLTQYLIDEIEQEYRNWLNLIAGLSPSSSRTALKMGGRWWMRWYTLLPGRKTH